jgi:hypothetical protein
MSSPSGKSRTLLMSAAVVRSDRWLLPGRLLLPLSCSVAFEKDDEAEEDGGRRAE